MNKNARKTSRQRLDERLGLLQPVERFRVPPKGWVRAIRDALGMKGVQLAKRLRISPQSVEALEKSEASGAIKLETLRRAAQALDCTLIYTLVPNNSLEQMVQTRARQFALRDLSRVAHTMKLEAQDTGDDGLEARIESYIRTTLRESDLWDDS